MTKERYILHVDMDAFFAAVEQRDNPQYRGRPVVVGADPKKGRGRGVVSTCSYEARRYGIHSAMPISKAYKLCPRAVYLRGNMEKYAAVSRQISGIFYGFTPCIEPVSIDEAFLDITGSYRLFGVPREICIAIKKRIADETGLTASVGLAPTMMAAKIASDLEKPDGFVEVTRKGLLDFLRPLPIKRLWGLGPKSEKALAQTGIVTIGDLAKADANCLTGVIGRDGYHFWRLANGVDERVVTPHEEAKSVSNETTFEKDTDGEDEIAGAFMRLCEKVSGRLRADGLKGRTVTLKIRLEGFHTYTRARTLAYNTNFVDDIFAAIKILYGDFDRKGKRVRLVGVKVSNLGGAALPMDLFSTGRDGKREKIHSAVDRIKQKFGNGSIHRAR